MYSIDFLYFYCTYYIYPAVEILPTTAILIKEKTYTGRNAQVAKDPLAELQQVCPSSRYQDAFSNVEQVVVSSCDKIDNIIGPVTSCLNKSDIACT